MKLAKAISGDFTAPGESDTFNPQADSSSGQTAGAFNVSLWGTFDGAVQLERSFDGGTTWLPLTALGTPIYAFTGPCSEICEEPEDGVQYRLNCTALTSGTINYRVSQ